MKITQLPTMQVVSLSYEAQYDWVDARWLNVDWWLLGCYR